MAILFTYETSTFGSIRTGIYIYVGTDRTDVQSLREKHLNVDAFLLSCILSALFWYAQCSPVIFFLGGGEGGGTVPHINPSE